MGWRHWAGVVVFGIAVLAGALLCARSTGHPGAREPKGAARWYVDPAYVGPEDGSVAMPFDTIAEAIDAAQTGDTIDLGAGTIYGVLPDGRIPLPRAVTVEGKGRDLTIVSGYFVADAPDEGVPTTIAALQCQEVRFDDLRVGPAPLVVRDARVDLIPIVHDPPHDFTAVDCEIGDISFSYGTGTGPAHHLIDGCTITGPFGVDFAYSSGNPGGSHVVRNSTIAGGVAFAHGEVTGPTENVVEGCTVDGGVSFSHPGGDVRNTVRNSTFTAGIRLAHGDITSNLIEGNRAQSFRDASGAAYTIVRGNTFDEGIVDVSGGAGGGVEDEIIEDNVVLDGQVLLRSASVTFRNNVVTSTSTEFDGVDAAAGPPTNLIGNRITIPTVAPTSDFCTFDPAALRTSSGAGLVEDNVLTGGACGILDSSAGDFERNYVTGTYDGVVTAGVGAWRDNRVTGALRDGFITNAAGPYERNEIVGSAGRGVVLLGVGDFGGGATGGAGGNTIRGSGLCDLVVDSGVVAEPIHAIGNAWDHADETDIRALDVCDERPGATADLVVLFPLACFGRLDLIVEGTVPDQDAGDVVVCLRGEAEL